MRRLVLFLPAMILLLLPLQAQPVYAFDSSVPSIVLVWGDGEVWEVINARPEAPGSLTPHVAHSPYYVIAPVDPDNPLGVGEPGLGPHDHVIHVPPSSQGTFTAGWHIYAVVPGPNAVVGANVFVRLVLTPVGEIPLVWAVDLNGDGTIEPLVRAEIVERADALGLVFLFDTDFHLVGGVRPLTD